MRVWLLWQTVVPIWGLLACTTVKTSQTEQCIRWPMAKWVTGCGDLWKELMKRMASELSTSANAQHSHLLQFKPCVIPSRRFTPAPAGTHSSWVAAWTSLLFIVPVLCIPTEQWPLFHIKLTELSSMDHNWRFKEALLLLFSEVNIPFIVYICVELYKIWETLAANEQPFIVGACRLSWTIWTCSLSSFRPSNIM